MNRHIKKELRRLGYPPNTTKITLSACSPRLFYLLAARNTRISEGNKNGESHDRHNPNR